MKNRNKIGILGGDMRQLALAALFAGEGYECALWGVACGAADAVTTQLYETSVRCVDWKDVLSGADAVILPLPLTTDGVRLNCGAGRTCETPQDLRLTEIIQNTDRSTVLFAGRIPAGIGRLASEHRVRMIDYYEAEDFQIKNAVPTAEGAIALAIDEMNITLAGAEAAVAGYGRIGRTLAQRLVALGAHVTCVARSRRDLAFSECDGCRALPLSDFTGASSDFDVIFNTVPHIIFDGNVLSRLRRDTLIIDLASMRGGVDLAEAERLGIRVLKALSLPGRTAPATAGHIIYDTVRTIMREEGIL